MDGTERKQQYRKRNRTYSISFPNLEAKRLQQHALSKGYVVPAYIKALIEADLTGVSYVIPDDGKLQELSLHFKRIGVNINQTVHWINRERMVTISDIRALQKHLSELESIVIDTLRKPRSILTVVKGHLSKHPEDRFHLLQYLNDNQSH